MFIVYYKHTTYNRYENTPYWKQKTFKTKRDCIDFAKIYFEFHSSSWNAKYRKPSQKIINSKIYYVYDKGFGFKKHNFLRKEI